MKKMFIISIISLFILGCNFNKNDKNLDLIDGKEPIGSVKCIPFKQQISTNWAVCDGKGYDINTYSNLFDVTKYNYGGNGIIFNVPNLNASFIKRPKGKFVIKMK